MFIGESLPLYQVEPVSLVIMIAESNLLRKPWRTWMSLGWRLGLVLILLLGIPRFYLVLQANIYGGYGMVSLVFLVMMILPFLLLTGEGRHQIGICRPESWSRMVVCLLVGMLLGCLLYWLGHLFYGNSIRNWYSYISQSYDLQDQWETSRGTFFVIFAIVSMTFSPIGEEWFYRGLVHECFRSRFGDIGASRLDSLAFALTHLAHFGIIYNGESWQFLFVPAMLWVGSMYLACRVFYRCRLFTRSIWGAVICHAGFNLAITYAIFYWIL